MSIRFLKDLILEHIEVVTEQSPGREPVCFKIRCFDKESWDHTTDTVVANDKHFTLDWVHRRDGPIELFIDRSGKGNTQIDSGYGAQELFGYIWYNDGTWSERAEYDGAEWWEHKIAPNFDTVEI